MIADVIMIIRLMNKVGITTEIIRVVLFSSIRDFTMVVLVVVGLLILGTTDDTSYWEETVMFSLSVDKVDSIMIMDELENSSMLVEGVCTVVKIDSTLVGELIVGDGEQGTLANSIGRKA